MKKQLFLVTLVSVAVLMLSPFTAKKVHAVADCSAGKSQNIVAHTDDDLFFINPKILQDIHAGKCVETIVVTAADAGVEDDGYWMGREVGLKAAYANMAGVPDIGPDTWSESSLTILGHTVQLSTLTAKPEVTLLFMRIPNGGQHCEIGEPNDLEHCKPGEVFVDGWASNGYKTLRKLWQNTISTIPTKDDLATYTRQEVIDVLATRMATYGAPTIRTLNYERDVNERDHSDHQAVAYFARAAHDQKIMQPHAFIGFEAYFVVDQLANVSGSDLIDKQNAYFAYDPYDGGTCSNVPDCAASEFPYRLDWLERNYEVGSETNNTGLWDWETVEGDTGSLSNYNANVGNQPASTNFNGANHTFYYDSSAGNLRHAIKTSSGWQFETLDGAGGGNGRISSDLGQSPTVTVYNNTLHLFYFDFTNGDLRYAQSSDGTNWSFQTLDGASGTLGGLNNNLGQTPKALVYGASLQLFYYDASLGNLRHAYLIGGTWHFENLEGDIGSISNYNSNIGTNVTAVEYGGTLQLFYYDLSTGNLRHAYSNATGWHFENLDGDPGSILGFDADTGVHPNAVVDVDTLHVFYYDNTHGDLRHAWTSPTQGWLGENLMGDEFAIIRSNVNVGLTPEAIVYNNQVHLFAYEVSNGGKLVHLWKEGSDWKEEHLDGFGTTATGGIDGSIGLEPTPVIFDSQLHVFYYDVGSGNLRRVFKS